MRIFDLCVTGLLTIYTVYRQKEYGNIKSTVLGMGFFSIAFYPDSIFYLIMRNVAPGHYLVGADSGMAFQLMGMLISKSVIAIGLTAWTVIRRDFAGNMADGFEARPDRQKACGGSGGWQYLDGLTAGIAVFSVMLALECMGAGRDEFAVALRLLFLLLLLAAYYVSVSFYRKKMDDRERKAAIEQQRDEIGRAHV